MSYVYAWLFYIWVFNGTVVVSDLEGPAWSYLKIFVSGSFFALDFLVMLLISRDYENICSVSLAAATLCLFVLMIGRDLLSVLVG